MAERLQGLLGVTLYLLLVLYFQYPLMRDAFMCLCTGTSLQETKLRTARLITFRPTHPVRSEGSTKQTAGCFTMRQNVTELAGHRINCLAFCLLVGSPEAAGAELGR